MDQILDRLIAQAPAQNEGTIEAQITFRKSGRRVAGAVKAVSEIDGLYEVLSVGMRPTKNGVPPEHVMVKLFFRAADVESVEIPWKSESPTIASPRPSGIVIPGQS